MSKPPPKPPKPPRPAQGTLAWSSEPKAATPGPTPPAPPGRQTAKIHLEKAGRGGKTVTVVRGLTLPEPDLEALGKRLKQSCGTGGTVKDGAIEVQGDHRDAVEKLLRERGYDTKRSGG